MVHLTPMAYRIIDLYNLLGSLICHQMPERTISVSGIPLPVCARDTGIYLGIFAGTVFAVVTGRMKADKQPSVLLSAVLCMLMIPMMFDGIGSYLGLLHTDNTVRLFTGALFGLSLQFFLLPAANFKIDGINMNRILRNPLELLAVVVALILLCMAVLRNLLPYFLLGTVVIASLVFLLGRITFTVIALACRGNRKSIYFKTTGAVILVMTAMYLLSAYVLQPLKVILLGRG